METIWSCLCLDEKDVLDWVWEVISFEVVDIESFSKFNVDLNNYICKHFTKILNTKTDSFKDAFRSWMTNLFQDWTVEEDEFLVSLIFQKNRLNQKIFRDLLMKWFFDKLFWDKEKKSILFVLDTNILAVFDQIYLNWLKNLPDSSNNGFKDIWLNYGWVKWGNIVSYGDFMDTEFFNDLDNVLAEIWDLDDEELWSIYQQIVIYIKSLVYLIKHEDVIKSSWSDIEPEYLRTWTTNSNLAVIWPLEYFIHPNFVVPEFAIYLKRALDVSEKDFACRLSKLFFGSDYEIWTLNIYDVENILSSWFLWFKRYMWRNFPNIQENRDNYWTIVYLSYFDNLTSFEIYSSSIKSVIWEEEYFKIDIKTINKAIRDSVVWHELWHNLFWWLWTISRLEETKAQLFHNLKVYYDFKEWKLTQKDKEIFVYTLVYRIIKTLKKFKNKDPYVVQSEIFYKYMRDVWLVSFDWDKLNINITDLWLQWFFDMCLDLLNMIKISYEDNNFEKESQFIKEIELAVNDDCQLIFDILSK